MLEAFAQGFVFLVRPEAIVFLFAGALIGLVFGILPGLGGVLGLAVALPFTFGMEPWLAMFFLAAIMGAVSFGGSISAILVNTPGTPLNAATCLDGFPMTRKGQGGKALMISATASAAGGIFGLLVLLLLLPLVRALVLMVGPPEMLPLVIFGLVTVSFAAKGNLIKGIFVGGIGILISLVGFDPMHGTLTFTLGSEYLWDGVPLIPFLIGMFAISELIAYSVEGGTIAQAKAVSRAGWLDGMKALFRHKLCFFRSAAIGTGIGIIPGVGGTVSNFLSYLVAKQTSRHPETFGSGEPEGLIASESANNATDGGALLPTVGFGIPGSAPMAVLLGGFMLHGLPVGPLLLRDHLDIVFSLFFGVLLSCVVASIIGLLATNLLAKVPQLNVVYIAPVVLVLCLAGAYAMRQNVWDVALAIVAGLFGYGMKRFGFPVICMVIGFILGPIANVALQQSLMLSRGSYVIFFASPISQVLIGLVVLTILFPLVKGRLAKVKR